jgi:ABC-type iron transport system FetAB permease component
MRRLLRLPAAPPAEKAPDAQKAFSTSILVSAVRCLLTYIVLPFVAPALGFATGVGPAIGLAIGLVAITSNVFTIRRFWRADHARRWQFTAISTSVIVLLLVLMAQDIAHLVT